MASKGFRSAVARRAVAIALSALTVTAVVGTLVVRASGPATASGTAGYWLAGSDGGVFNYGQAPFYGSAGAVPLNNPVVGFVPTPSAAGYWMVASDGGIFAFGDAAFLGSMGGKPLNRPIASMAAAPNGRGYWLVASDGGVFAFGDAPFFGSLAGEKLTKPIVDFATTPTGGGYWMATSDGAVYGFGDAGYYGSVGTGDLSRRIQALAPTPTGRGYWLVSGDGSVFTFGDAGNFGSAAGQTEKRVLDIAPTSTGRGYYLVTSNGQVFPYGDATGYGDASKSNINNHIAAIAAATPSAGTAPATGNGTGNGGGAEAGAGTALQAVDDSADGEEDTPLNIDVVGNDKAPPGGGPLTLQSVTPPEHGRASIADNRVAYQPAPDYHGPDTFTYTVTDAGGASSTGTVHITLASVDDRPEAVDDAVTITDGSATTIDVAANDRGLGDGLKSVAVIHDPAHGTAAVTPEQKITYTPASGFNGTDTLEYRVTDTDDESSTAKVTITIGGTNHVPVAVDDSATSRAGRQTLLDVTSNDNVADGVKEVRFADANGAPIDAPDIGTAAGGIARRSGTKIAYTAPPGTFTGSDSFTYVVLDNDGEVSKPATVRATVVTNKSPQVKDGAVSVPQNRQAAGSIAKLGWDPEKDSITFSLRSSPAGQLTLKPDGSFLYQAPAGVDVDTFSFVANDGNTDSNEGHLSIQVTQAQATAASSSSTTTTGKASTTTTAGKASTTATAGKASTTATTGKPSTTATTGKPSTTTTTGKPSTTSTTWKAKKPASSNNRGKPTTSTSTTSKALLLPMLPLAAAPAVTRRRRRRRRSRSGR